MTIIAPTPVGTRVRCDHCPRTWAYIVGDVEAGLRAAGWGVGDGHECPRCVRKHSREPAT